MDKMIKLNNQKIIQKIKITKKANQKNPYMKIIKNI